MQAKHDLRVGEDQYNLITAKAHVFSAFQPSGRIGRCASKGNRCYFSNSYIAFPGRELVSKVASLRGSPARISANSLPLFEKLMLKDLQPPQFCDDFGFVVRVNAAGRRGFAPVRRANDAESH